MISGLTPELLKRAIEMFAQQIGGTVFYNKNVDRRYNYGGEKCLIGFKANDLPYGINFDINEAGELVVGGDAYGQNQGFNKYKAMAESGVITNALLIMVQAAQEQATVQMQVQEDRIVMEVEYLG